MTVAVMVAYHKAQPWVRRAVDSILVQTYSDLRCYVVNDADNVTPPWDALRDITDRRLIRFDLPQNRGRYFADAVVLEASPDTYWALMDPDDWCEPDRLEALVPIAAEKGLAQAPHWLYPGSFDAKPTLRKKRLGRRVWSKFKYHAGYASAVTSTERIRDAGGFHADMRIGYDTLLTQACKLVGPFGTHPKPFTHKIRRRSSLMTSPATRPGSRARDESRERMERLWKAMYQRGQAGQEVASIVRDDIPPAIRQEVTYLAAQLKERIP